MLDVGLEVAEILAETMRVPRNLLSTTLPRWRHAAVSTCGNCSTANIKFAVVNAAILSTAYLLRLGHDKGKLSERLTTNRWGHWLEHDDWSEWGR